MPTRILAGAALLALATVRPAVAQSPSSACLAQASLLQDACQKGTDFFQMLTPQVTGAITGGGAVLGSARSVNGFSIGLRVNAVDGQVPDIRNLSLSTTGIARTAVPTRRLPVPVPAVDVAIGLVPGFVVGMQRIFSIDALVNVAYLPSRDIGGARIKDTNGSLKLGYGANVGILADRFLMPAVAVSYFRRSLPTMSFSSSFASSLAGMATRDSLSLDNLGIETEAIRLSASKKLGFLEIGGGVGQDRYKTGASLRARVSPSIGSPVAGAVALAQVMKRNAAYGSVALNLFRLRIAAEAGASFSGDTVQTYNSFPDGKVNETRYFGSVGLRLGF